MANSLFDKGRESFLGSAGTVPRTHWTNNAQSFFLMDNNYTVNLTGHTYLADVSAIARRSGPVTIANKVGTNGAADGDDIRFNSVTGAQVVGILGYDSSTGVEATSVLILWIDTATGLPITPNGGDIIVSWDNGTNKIFKL